MFEATTGNTLDTMKSFQDLRGMIRNKGNKLCKGSSANATRRRNDMIAILEQAATLLETESEKYWLEDADRTSAEVLAYYPGEYNEPLLASSDGT